MNLYFAYWILRSVSLGFLLVFGQKQKASGARKFGLRILGLSSPCLGEPSNVSQPLSIRQYSQGSDFSELDCFLYKSKVLNILEICDALDGTNLCMIGTTTKLIVGKGRWFYYSCGRCKYQCKFNSSSMMKMSNDVDIIKNITKQIYAQQGVADITEPSCYKTQASKLELSQIEDFGQFDKGSTSQPAHHNDSTIQQQFNVGFKYVSASSSDEDEPSNIEEGPTIDIYMRK
ncbi:hypothetical protein JHK86_027389 [Glycine max]|nr:hypothetical protein JHK86_027389 [Glycine max]